MCPSSQSNSSSSSNISISSLFYPTQVLRLVDLGQAQRALMGDSGSRRSIIVSRLPIFRRSISRRHDSLPSSPSSISTVGVHSSSPTSTNSSSGSTGKRRSLFRTPSISFHHKKGGEQKADCPSQTASVSNGAQSNHNALQKHGSEEHAKIGGRHSVRFGSYRSKKITRSLTEDFERGKEPSTHKNVFINCIRSGKNDGDDSGFIEEQSRCPVKHPSRKLLPKSFSTHYKFSKPVSQSQSASCVPPSSFILESKPSVDSEPASASPSPSASADVIDCVGSSLQSPLLSADLTTVQTPSDFLALTEDSVSEVDGLLNCGNSHTETFVHNVSTSQIFLNPMAATPRFSRKSDWAESVSPHSVISPGSHKGDRNLLLKENTAVSEVLDSNQNHARVLLREHAAKKTCRTEELNSGAEAQLKPFVLNQGEIRECSPRVQGSLWDQWEIKASERIREATPAKELNIIPSSLELPSFQTHQKSEMGPSKGMMYAVSSCLLKGLCSESV